MRLGLLSDAHGNDACLRLCIDFLMKRKVDRFFFLGDAVGYFPEPARTMELLNEVEAFCLLGNHDAMLLGSLPCDTEKDKVYQIELSRQALSDGYRCQLADRRPSAAIELDGKRILLVHGSPADPLNGYIYPDSDLAQFENQPFAAVFMGHTHRPLLSRQGGMILLNPGSCGLPRDQGNLPACAIYDTASGLADIFRILTDADWLVDRYRGRIHRSVLNCVMRKSKGPLFGKAAEQ